MKTINNINLYKKNKNKIRSLGGVLIGLVSLIVLSYLGLSLLNNNQVKAAAPDGFGVSVDTAAGAVNYKTGASNLYLSARIKLVTPSNYVIPSTIGNLGFKVIKSSEIKTKCVDLNNDDGSRDDSANLPAAVGTAASGDYYHAFGTLDNSPSVRIDKVFIKLTQLADATANYKLCVELPYQREGSSETMYAYVATETEFTKAPPKAIKISVTLDGQPIENVKLTAADMGKEIRIIYTFDRPVKIVKTDNSAVQPLWIEIPLQVFLGSSRQWYHANWPIAALTTTPLNTYSRTIEFSWVANFRYRHNKAKAVTWNDEYYKANNKHQILLWGGGRRANKYDIVDEHGRKMPETGNSGNSILNPDAKISNFEIILDTTPIVTLKQTTGGFDIMYTPEKYEHSGVEYATITPKTDSFVYNANVMPIWNLRSSATKPAATDKCEAGTSVVSGTVNKIKAVIPATPNSMWYCVHANDITGRKAASEWTQYVSDTTGPVISHTVVNNKLTLSVTDTGVGYKDGSLAWGSLDSESECELGFVIDFSSKSMSFVITEDIDDQAICVKASDNAGNVSYKKVTLKRNQQTTTTDDEKPEANTDDDTTKDTSGDTDKDTDQDKTQTTTTVNCDNLPDNWNDLTVSEKVRLNPCKCNDTTQIRADNGQCLSGGHSRTTTTTDDDETTTPAPPTTTDDDNTMDDNNTEDTMDNEDQTGDEEQTQEIRFSFDFNDSTRVLTVTTTGGELSNYEYALVDSSLDCGDNADYMTMDDSMMITVTQEDIDNNRVVCVQAENEDGGIVADYYTLTSTTTTETPEDQTKDEDTTQTTTEDEDSNNNLWFIIGGIVLVIIIIAIIVFVSAKNKVSLLTFAILSLLGLSFLYSNQVNAAAPSGFGVSVDTTAGAIDYNSVGNDSRVSIFQGEYLGVRIKLVSPSEYIIESDLSSLGFTFIKSNEITTKCTDLNKDDGSRADEADRPPAHTSEGNYHHTFGTVDNSPHQRTDRVFVRKEVDSEIEDGKDYKICVEIPYHRKGGSETMYAYVATSTEFNTAPPKITDVTFKSASYTAADINKNTRSIIYTFDKPVKVVRVSDSAAILPYINVNLRPWDTANKRWSTAGVVNLMKTPLNTYSKTIEFGGTVAFRFDNKENSKWNDEWYEADDNDKAKIYLGINLTRNDAIGYMIYDKDNREVASSSQLAADGAYLKVPDADINDFEITYDTTPIVTLKQTTGGFDIMHTPETFEDKGVGYKTITANWSLLKRTTQPKAADKCETGTGVTTVTTGTKAQIKAQMSSTPDKMWYCVHANDVLGRKAESKWMQYITDQTGPVISHTVTSNRLTFTVTDIGVGYKDGSLAWGVLRSDAKCLPGFVVDFSSNLMSFAITENLNNRVICVKASDNAGNVSYKKVTLKRNQQTTTTDDEKPEATTDDDTTKDTSDDDMNKDDDGQTQTTVDCNNLPDNWNSLTVSEKVRLNPCKCNDTTQIRADNGQCLSGGHSRTTTTDDDEVTTPAPPTTTDDDEDMMDDEDQTGDDNTVDNDLAEIILSFNDEDKVLTLIASGGELSNWMYTIIESGQCSPDMDGYQTVDGNTVTVTQDDIDNEKTVCVKADRSDGSTVTQTYTLGQTTPSDETTPGDETGNESSDETTDDDGTNPILIIGIVVLVIAIIGVIIFVVNKNKNSNQI